jgi:hypothetical protein
MQSIVELQQRKRRMARISLDGNDEDGGLEVRISSCLSPSLSFHRKRKVLLISVTGLPVCFNQFTIVSTALGIRSGVD